MKILSVSDLHYSLRQFDWLVKNHQQHDLIVIAGDFMQLGSSVDSDVQTAVVEQYFRKICQNTPLVVCSGNHDLVDEGDGKQTTEWLTELVIPGLVVDKGSYTTDRLRVLSLPWWGSETEKEQVASWLAEQHDPGDQRPVIWVHHAPPRGARTSWNGKRDLGDSAVVEWIAAYSPNLVLSGHVHNAPYYPEGSWVDHVGKTMVINGGQQTGDTPATIVIELDKGLVTWSGMEGCRDAPLVFTTTTPGPALSS